MILRGDRRVRPLLIAVMVMSGLVLLGACTTGASRSAAPPSPGGRQPEVTSVGSRPITPTSANTDTTGTSTTISAPAGPHLLDLTWISNDRGWALASMPCPTGTRGVILATTDGGVTWAPSGPEPAQASGAAYRSCVEPGCLEHLRFASSTVGYLWGQGIGLFMTLDGGRSWRVEPTSQMVTLEPVGRWVLRVAAPQGLADPLEVDRAAVGSEQW